MNFTRFMLSGMLLLAVLVSACSSPDDPGLCRDGATAVFVDMLDHGLDRETGQARVDQACGYLSISDRKITVDAAKEAVIMGYRP